MSKITNDGLIQSGKGCTHMATVGIKGLNKRFRVIKCKPLQTFLPRTTARGYPQARASWSRWPMDIWSRSSITTSVLSARHFAAIASYRDSASAIVTSDLYPDYKSTKHYTNTRAVLIRMHICDRLLNPYTLMWESEGVSSLLRVKRGGGEEA